MKKLHCFVYVPVLLGFLSAGCFKPDETTFVVSVPGMAGPDCGNLINRELSKIEGISYVVPDYDKRTVTVTYKNMKVAKKNIEYAITHTGFEANGNPPIEEARENLPAGCR